MTQHERPIDPAGRYRFLEAAPIDEMPADPWQPRRPDRPNEAPPPADPAGARLSQALDVARHLPVADVPPSHVGGPGATAPIVRHGGGSPLAAVAEPGPTYGFDRTAAPERAAQSFGGSTRMLPSIPPADSVADPMHPAQAVVDLRRSHPDVTLPRPVTREPRYGLGSNWGSDWERSAQGWIGKDTANPVWRPVITTTEQLGDWEVDTYLGVITAEVAVESLGGQARRIGETLAHGREVGLNGLRDEAIDRGAHGVIGVSMRYTELGARLLITLTGTAVTLREKSRPGER